MHLAVNIGGIPYLAKNERDMGHPSLCEGTSGRPQLPEFVKFEILKLSDVVYAFLRPLLLKRPACRLRAVSRLSAICRHN
jgi:hypothetical protein